MKQLLLAFFVVPLMLIFASVGHADANDDDFVAALENVGVRGTPQDLITNAQLVCSGLGDGTSPALIRDAFVSQMGFAPNRAGIFVALSATHYCPQFGNLKF